MDAIINKSFPPFLNFELEDEVNRTEKTCSDLNTEYHISKGEIQKNLIERMIANYNVTAKNPLKVVQQNFYDTVRSSNPKDLTQWDWNNWNTKLTRLEGISYQNNVIEGEKILDQIAKIIYPEINWKEQVDTLKALQAKDGIPLNKIYEVKNIIDIIRNYRHALKPITELIKGMISEGFLTRQTIDAIYSCVMDKE